MHCADDTEAATPTRTGDQRRFERVTGPFKGRWHAPLGPKDIVIPDVSADGCFVETTFHLPLGERVDLELHLAPIVWLLVRGEVVRRETGRGVGLQFHDLTHDVRKVLRGAVRYHLEQGAART